MLIKNALVYRNDTHRFEKMCILIKNGRIAALGQESELSDSQVFDACGMCVTSGLIDVHTHGRAGYDFVECGGNQLGDMASSYAKRGVTTVMPTLASAEYRTMLSATKMINDFVPSTDQADLCGVHWEGRYLNPSKKGAHALSLLAPLDPKEMEAEELKDCKALHITAAFELDTDGEFAKAAKKCGATLGLGHTAASYSEAIEAEKNGVTAYTHTFNAMPPLHHRYGGAVCAALTGEAYAELICDGIHVSREMVALTYRMKGAQKLSLISDSMQATGCSDGNYSIAGNPVIVKNGKAVLEDGTLAGSTLSVDEAVRNLMSFCSIPLEDAIICATEAPAREIGVFDSCGSIDIGKKADMLFISNKDNFKIEKIMLRGNFI